MAAQYAIRFSHLEESACIRKFSDKTWATATGFIDKWLKVDDKECEGRGVALKFQYLIREGPAIGEISFHESCYTLFTHKHKVECALKRSRPKNFICYGNQ